LQPPKNPPNQITDVYLNQDIKSITDMMHSLTIESDNLHRLYSKRKTFRNDIITFIELVHNPVMNVVIIVIPNGQRLPLHDHPNMVGMLKVLHGQVRISTYTKIGFFEQGRQPAIRTQNGVILSRLNYPQVITPLSNNIHEVEFVSGECGKDYAAIIDVLTPPYDDNVGCRYYVCEEVQSQETSDIHNQECTLVETECPKEYHTTCLPYTLM
jgi:cysteamine dioxygenase